MHCEPVCTRTIECGVDMLDWLLDSDPAIRWQAIRDLTDASPALVQLERNRVAREGLGAEILAHQQHFLQFAFPPRYHYDVLRALDYFRCTGIESDRRMLDAVQIIRKRQQADGRWLLDHAYVEVLAVPFAEVVGAPSRWNTLRALRVLRWYEQSAD